MTESAYLMRYGTQVYRTINEILPPIKMARLFHDDIDSLNNYAIDYPDYHFDSVDYYCLIHHCKPFEELSQWDRKEVFTMLCKITNQYQDHIDSVIFHEDKSKRLYGMTKKDTIGLCNIMSNTNLLLTDSIYAGTWFYQTSAAKLSLIYLAMRKQIYGLENKIIGDTTAVKYMKGFIRYAKTTKQRKRRGIR